MHRAILIAVTVFGLGVTSTRAGHLIGPVPYLSQADSPFDLSGLGTTMFLEDFEQGVPNMPGLPAYLGDVVQLPGQFTDSVDADDGAIDGYGKNGHSLRSRSTHIEPTNPPRIYHSLPIDIETETLGFVPNLFGFVLTDGPSLASVEIQLRDEEHRLIRSYIWGELFVEPLLDNLSTGETTEDLFFGIYEAEGIKSVEVVIMTRDESVKSFEMDHVQYGLAVPEPRSCSLAITATFFALSMRFALNSRFYCFPPADRLT